MKIPTDKLLLIGSLILGAASAIVEDKQLDRKIEKKLEKKEESK